MKDVRKVLEDAVIKDLVNTGENDSKFLEETFSQGFKGVWNLSDKQLVNEVMASELADGETFTHEVEKATVIMQHQTDNPDYLVTIVQLVPVVANNDLHQRDKALSKAYPVFLPHSLGDYDIRRVAIEVLMDYLAIVEPNNFQFRVYTKDKGEVKPDSQYDVLEAYKVGDCIGQKVTE